LEPEIVATDGLAVAYVNAPVEFDDADNAYDALAEYVTGDVNENVIVGVAFPTVNDAVAVLDV